MKFAKDSLDSSMSTKPLRAVVLGAGGHAVSVRACLQQFSVVGFAIADPALAESQVEGSPDVYHDDWIIEQDPSSFILINAIGSTAIPDRRRAVFVRFKNAGFAFATLVHPAAVIEADVQLGEGAQIMAGAVVQAGAVVGPNSLVNTGVTVDHNSTIAPHCHIAPGATICGSVCIGEATHVGAGSTVIQSVSIGSRCLIAAGSVVVHDVDDGCRMRGNPARPF
ncbi:acetyltransferase [Pelagibius sp.]|uniref:acetyltransferase n=1 Tax=Pelagibius sp. TaxID=1931238 RepID=UPI003B5077A2